MPNSKDRDGWVRVEGMYISYDVGYPYVGIVIRPPRGTKQLKIQKFQIGRQIGTSTWPIEIIHEGEVESLSAKDAMIAAENYVKALLAAQPVEPVVDYTI